MSPKCTFSSFEQYTRHIYHVSNVKAKLTTENGDIFIVFASNRTIVAGDGQGTDQQIKFLLFVDL